MMKRSTIPFTPTAPGWTSVHPRPLRPIHPHPDLDEVDPPTLPCPPRPPVFHTTTRGVYRLSTHLVPAAYPRRAPEVPLPKIPEYEHGESSARRRDKVGVLVNQVCETQAAYEQGTLGGTPSGKLLWNCVNRYVCTATRSSRKSTAVTLFLAHANGLHKETWEVMLRELIDAPAGEMIDEVWAWDAVQHGDAAVVNADHLGGIFDWLDNTRDIANFLLHYLPEDVETAVLPTRLPRLPAGVTKLREERGYRTRELVVVGHSFGGCTSLRVAFDLPKLFSSFVLVDPVIHRPHVMRQGHLHRLVHGAFGRRERWSSRKDAREAFQRSPFFGAWHPEVLGLYVDHALIDDEDGVRLKMSALQEGLSFANLLSTWETWELLERLDERIALRWVVPEVPLSSKEATYERVWRRPVNSSNVMFHFAGHLIVQEAPLELAHDVSEILMGQHGCTRARM